MHEQLSDPGRPRAVADAPIADLLDGGEALARAWLAQIVAGWPLDRMVQIPLGEIAIGGPSICRAALRAVADDEALARIDETAGLLRTLPPELAVRAAEALRRSLWSALISELRGADPGQLAQLADRLGHVCAVLAAAGVELADGGHAPQESGPLQAAPMHAPVEAPAPRRLREAGSALDGDPGIPEPWLEAIGRRVQVRARDARPFAVLLVEVDGRERLAAADLDGDVVAALARAERVLLKRLRPGDQLLRDQPGRYWVIAPDTDAAAAHLLAWGFAAAPQEVDGHRGVPLLFAVGIALCPGDGEHARSLAEHAEDALLEARAAGVGVS